jgi:hypothetical protein
MNLQDSAFKFQIANSQLTGILNLGIWLFGEIHDLLFFSALASRTQTVYLQPVALDFKMVLARNVLLKLFYPFILKLYDGPAFRANQVVVVTVRGPVLIAVKTVFKVTLLGKTGFGQKLQGPVHRGETDAGMGFLHASVQFLRAHVFAGIHEYFQDLVPLVRGPEPLAGKVVGQLFYGCFSHNLILITIFN